MRKNSVGGFLLVLAVARIAGADTIAFLLTQGDEVAAHRDLEARGAKITHFLPDSRVVARIPEGFSPGTEVVLRSVPMADALPRLGEEMLVPDLEPGEDGDALVGTSDHSPALVGDIVLALALPESTGEAEPDLVSWTGADVERAIAVAVDGTLRLVLAPGAPPLRFRIHLLSSPPPGGVPGTVASARETFRYTNFDTRADGAWLETLGFAGDVPSARRALLDQLRRSYNADAAYIGKVIHHGSQPPGRASALLGGPQVTWFLGSTPYAVMHETAHAFGAQDEYCPDACRSPSELSGAAQVANANSRGNDGTGYFGGAGEGLPCMMLRDTDRICPHTRNQLGWSDRDLDGVPDVMEQIPTVTLTTTVEDGQVVARGSAVAGSRDSGSLGIVGVDVRVARNAWVAATADDGAFDRPREEFTLRLPLLPNGEYLIEARARTSSGNVSLLPARSVLIVSDSDVSDAAPFANLSARPARALAGTPVELDASWSSDLGQQPLTARFDFEADGTWDTGFGPLKARILYPQPGLHLARVEVRDIGGAVTTATAAVEATAFDVPPTVELRVTPQSVSGDSYPSLAADATQSLDPEGSELHYRYNFGTPGEEVAAGAELTASRAVGVVLSESVPVSVTVSDGGGNRVTVTRVVPVVAYNHAPIAALAVRPGTAPLEWVLDASASADADAETTWDGIRAYRFDFEGDGIFDTAFEADHAVVAHDFDPERSHLVAVEVRDRFMATARADVALDLRSMPTFTAGVGLAAEATACGVELTWSPATALSGPVTYAVYRAEKAALQWTLIAEVARPGYRDTSGRAGREYSWLVRAWAPGEPPLEDTNTESVSALVPGDGTRLTAVRGEDSLVEFRWSPSGPATLMASPKKGGEFRAVAVGDSRASMVSIAVIAFFEVSRDSCGEGLNVAAR